MKIEDVETARELIAERRRIAMLRGDANAKIAVWICGTPAPPVFAEVARPAILAEIDRQIAAINSQLADLGVEVDPLPPGAGIDGVSPTD